MRNRVCVWLFAAAVGACGTDSNGDSQASGADDGIGATSNGQTSGGAGTSGVDDGLTTSISETSKRDIEMMCGESMFVLETVPPNVMLVLDKSGSMTIEWDSDGMGTLETRWASLHDVVESVLTAFDAEVNFGAMLFPSEDADNDLDDGACEVEPFPEVPVLELNAANILGPGGIPARDEVLMIQGATPASAGIATAVQHLKGLNPNVERFMILITDGAANCGAAYAGCTGLGCGSFEFYDTDLPMVVGDAFMMDEIPTFVVGINMVEGFNPSANDMDGITDAVAYDELNTVADAGGRPRAGAERFYNALNQIELEAALQEIAGQVVSCVIPLDPEPEHPDFVEIEIGGAKIDRVMDCATEDGWVFVNPDGPYDAIELCGAACGLLSDSGELDALYGCPPQG